MRKALAVVLVLGLVAAGGVAWQTGWAEEWWDRVRDGDQPAAPADVAPPPELDVPDVVLPPPVAPAADGSVRLDRRELARALAELGDQDLGRHVIAAVGPLDGKGVAYRAEEGARVAIPASTTKIVTAAAALFLLGPDERFETTTVLDASGTTPRLVLVGGGDPYLARRPPEPDDGGPSATYYPRRADVVTLARRTARGLKAQGIRSVELAFDDTLFTGPQVHPTWEPDYIPDDVVSPISALWVDQGREPESFDRVADPAATAAAEFRRALVRFGIRVSGEPVRGTAAAGASLVGAVTSPTVAQIVQRVLEASDNEAAEVLLRHVGLADQGSGSFDAGRAAVERVLTANGIRLAGTVLHDGSGLSRASRIAPSVLLGVLRLAASPEHPDLRPVLTSLPVAGYTGSLTNRMDQGPADGLGRVRAKTGTLTGVTSLAGIAVDLDGNLMAFALLADRIRKPKEGLARIAMDNAAASLGACRCGR